MKIKIGQLKKIIKEAGGSISASPMPTQADPLVASVDGIVQNTFPHYINELLYAAMQTLQTTKDTNQENQTFEAQIGKATQDLVSRLDPIITSKISSLTKEVLENIKNKKYTENNKVERIDAL